MPNHCLELGLSHNVEQARLMAWQALNQVIIDKKSLAVFWEDTLNKLPDSRERAFCHEIVFGSLRHYQSLKITLNQCLKKPLSNKNKALETLLISALYQLKFLNSADYAVINESVNLCQQPPFVWAKSLVNAVLRHYIKSGKPYRQTSNLPEWLLTKLSTAYPAQMADLEVALQTAPSVMLRVHEGDRQVHIDQLNEQGIACKAHPDAKEAIILTNSANIFELPAFQSGQLTVQDANAQLAANLLQIKGGQTILDACAAPGGKTAHIYAKSKSLNPKPSIIALDNSEKRTKKMQQTLARLHCDVEVLTDSLENFSQFSAQRFDRILLDAPCSATGVMAKHPDIAFIRDKATIDELVKTQTKLLEAAWQLLAPKGILLYATCSILPEENHQQISHFLSNHPDAQLDKLAHNRTITDGSGSLQFLPGELGDGFFYARLKKISP